MNLFTAAFWFIIVMMIVGSAAGNDQPATPQATPTPNVQAYVPETRIEVIDRSGIADHCAMHEAFGQYVSNLYALDDQGQPTMDVDNGALATLPEECRETVRIMGQRIADGY